MCSAECVHVTYHVINSDDPILERTHKLLLLQVGIKLQYISLVMAEGYSSIDYHELTYSLKIKDFKGVKGFRSATRCFYNMKGKTVLLYQLLMTVYNKNAERMLKHKRIRISAGRKVHAEMLFLQDIKKELTKLRKGGWSVEQLSVTMLISNSPCFKCRRELEHHFMALKKKTRLSLTLRIANLYKKGYNKSEAEDMLALWKFKLELSGVRVELEAINVLRELTVESVSEDQKQKRMKRDDEIADCVHNIEYGNTQVNLLVDDISPAERKNYFFSDDGKQMMLGRLTVAAITDTNELTQADIIPLAKKVSDTKENSIGEQIIADASAKIPSFCKSIRKSLLLISTNLPSFRCRKKIKEFLTSEQPTETTNSLTLFLANLHTRPPEMKKFIKWIQQLQESIDVCLQPLYVPLPILTGPIVDKYTRLRNDFQILKDTLNPLPPEETSSSITDDYDSTTLSSTEEYESSVVSSPSTYTSSTY